MLTIHNPILPGYNPDPSICRVGDDFYLVTSTFEYFPGLPIYHSRDLAHWRLLGYALDRPEQLDLTGVPSSGGLYAPTLRYHDGTFYIINTMVAHPKHPVNSNFIVTATNPAGPWSNPVWVDGAPGIDPSLLFDDDGRMWYCGNRTPPAGEQFTGHREIWLSELDPITFQLTGPTYALWDGALRVGVHAEAPHLYKIDGTYYLLIAEGGTHYNHAVTIARAENITGPYEGSPRNPVLTHRNLGAGSPITSTGHADIVQLQDGTWWMVLLATRPYAHQYYNMGRESFIVPLEWLEGWPVASPGTGKIEWTYPGPDLPPQRWPAPPACDNFEAPTLAPVWNYRRTPHDPVIDLAARPGWLRLPLIPHTLGDLACPAFVGRRQQHMVFTARCAMEFTPAAPGECAGLTVIQNDDHQMRCERALDANGAGVVRLIVRDGGQDSEIASLPCSADHLYLMVDVEGADYRFYVAEEPEAWQPLGDVVDGRVISTHHAGGFTGVFVGMFATASGAESANHADFDWFEYVGQEHA